MVDRDQVLNDVSVCDTDIDGELARHPKAYWRYQQLSADASRIVGTLESQVEVAAADVKRATADAFERLSVEGAAAGGKAPTVESLKQRTVTDSTVVASEDALIAKRADLRAAKANLDLLKAAIAAMRFKQESLMELARNRRQEGRLDGELMSASMVKAAARDAFEAQRNRSSD